MDVVLRRIAIKVTWNSSFESFTTVLESLDNRRRDLLRQSFLWPLYQLRGMQYSGQIINALPCQLLNLVDDDVLHLDLGQGRQFLMFEFAPIAMKQFATLFKEAIDSPTHFQGQGIVLLPQLIGTIRECDHMLDRLKLKLVYILKSMVRHHHKKTVIELFIWKLLMTSIHSTVTYGDRDILRTPYTFSPDHIRSQCVLVN